MHVLRYPTEELVMEEPAVKLTPPIEPSKKQRGRPKKAIQIVDKPKIRQVARYAAIMPISKMYNVI